MLAYSASLHTHLKSVLWCKAHTINSVISEDSIRHPAHHFFISDLPTAIYTTITHKSLAVSMKSLVYDNSHPSRFFWLQHKSHTLSRCSLEQWKQEKKSFSCADLIGSNLKLFKCLATPIPKHSNCRYHLIWSRFPNEAEVRLFISVQIQCGWS